jgi:hypothetical protein
MSTKKIIQIGLVTSIFVAAVVSFYASSNPDGLEFVAEQVGFLNTAKDSAVASSPLADYAFVGLDNEPQPYLLVCFLFLKKDNLDTNRG